MYNNCYRQVHHTPANTFKVYVNMEIHFSLSETESTETLRNPPRSCFTSQQEHRWTQTRGAHIGEYCAQKSCSASDR